VLRTDEWSELERTVNLLFLAIDGLDARSEHSILERRRDVTPLVWLALDLSQALQKFEAKVWRATVPARAVAPAELADPDRTA
jgi:hypothetical protein